MKFICLFTVVTLISVSVSSRIYRNPDILRRIPREIKDYIDGIVSEKSKRIISTHFYDEGGYFNKQRQPGEDEVIVRSRYRRDVNDTTDAVYSDWTEFGECSAKCGGGFQVRTRTCLKGNCTEELTLSRECGHLPCVSGTYVLTEISAYTNFPITDAKVVRFFDIKGLKYFGYITETHLFIRTWNPQMDTYVAHQTINVQEGVSFDIMHTNPRSYLVVLEKATSFFPGRSSKMYYYDPFNMKFQTSQAVTFDVWNPSAVQTFEVFGKSFLALVNYESKEEDGFHKEKVVCNGQTSPLTCPIGQIITVQNAFYGRISSWECPGTVMQNQYFTYCVISGIKLKISQLCDNKQSCTLTATASALTDFDSCVQTNKYLKVTYTCGRISYLGAPVFYRWDGIGLSLLSADKLVTSGAKDIESFSIHDQQYIAVANYINDKQSHHLDSEVYMYNLHSGRFQSLQRLRTDGAIDWEFFKVGEGLAQEYFLAVANHVKILPNGVTTYEIDSVIYKWNWNLFVPFQCMKTFGAMKWTAISGLNGEFFLTITNLYGNTIFYGYDGWRFYETKIQPVDEIFSNAESINTFLQYDQPMFVIRNDGFNATNSTKNVYQANFLKTFPKYELLETTLSIVQELNRTVYEELIPASKVFNTTYTNEKDAIVFVDQDVLITDRKIFDNIVVVHDTFVESATVQTVNLSPADLEYERRQNNVKELIDEQKINVVKANDVLVNAVTKSTPQTINSTLKFYKNITIQNVHVQGDLNIGGKINYVDLSELRDNALFIDQNDTIAESIEFNSIIFNDDFIIDGLIDGVSTDDLITIDQDEIIGGEKTFYEPKFRSFSSEIKNVQVDGFVNDMKLEDLLTVSGEQIITGRYTFNNTVYMNKNLIVRTNLNGLNISEIEKNTVMLTDQNITISSAKIFKDAIINGDLTMTDKTRINDVDISELLTEGIHLSTQEVINSSIVFSSNVTFLSAVTLTGKVNDQSLSEVIYTNIPATINGSKTFQYDVTFNKNVDIDGKLNDVDISGNVLDTITNQTITGEKTFQSDLSVHGDLSTTGSIDGVDISEAYGNTVFLNSTQSITGYKIINNITADDVIINDCDHDCQLLQVLQNLKHTTARKSNQTVRINGIKSFVNGLKLYGDIEVSGLVNGLDIPSDLMLQDAIQTLHGENTFVNVTMNIMVDQINGVNLTHIYHNAWRKGDNITLTGIKTFLDDVTINGNLYVDGDIDSVNLADVVLAHTDQNITGKKTFNTEMYIKELTVVNMTAHGLIDGVNLTYINSELVRMTGDTIITGTKIFKSHVSFAGNWSIPGLIDGVNITELNNNAMRIDGDQTVTALKTFSESINVHDELTVSKLVDGVNLTHLSKYSVKLNDQSNVTFGENITFNYITVQGNIDVNGLINNKNLSVIVKDTLLKDGDQVVSGNHVIANLNVMESVFSQNVNNMDFSEEVIPLDEASIVTGTKVFLTDVQSKNLQSYSVNTIDLNAFASRLLCTNKDAAITANMTIENFIIEKDLTVRNINNVNLTYLASTTLMKHGNQTITVPTHFNDVTFSDDVTNKDLFNGVNITHFSENVVFKCYGDNKHITGKFTFDNVNVQGDARVNELAVMGTINGIDLEELQRDTVTLTGNHTIYGVKHMTQPLAAEDVTANKVNNFSVPEDFVSLSGNDVITGLKEFIEDVTVLHDVPVSPLKTINGVDLSEFQKNIVSLNGSETVATPVEFHNGAQVNNNLLSESVNGVVISEKNLLLVDGDQNVTGTKTFSTINSLKDIVSNNDINGFHLLTMENETVLSGRNNIITGYKTINGNVYIEGNLETNLVDNSNVTELFSGFNKISDFLDRDLVHLSESIVTHSDMISQLGNSISDLHRALGYFIEQQVLLIPYISVSMNTFHSYGKTLLAVGALSDKDGMSYSNFSVYVQDGSKDFTTHSNVIGNAVVDTTFTQLGDAVYLTAISNKLHDNPDDPEVSVMYKLVGDAFQQVRTIATSHALNIDTMGFDDGYISVISNTNNKTTCLGQVLSFTNSTSTFIIATIPICDVMKSIVLSVTNQIITMATLSSGRYVEVFDVFRENSTYHRLQTMATYFASDILHFATNSERFLAIVNTYDTSSEALAVSFTVPVVIYRYGAGRFEKYQDINIHSAYKIKHFRIGTYDYMAIASTYQEIQIFTHKGASKWVKVLTVPIAGAGTIKDMTFWETSDSLYLGVLTDNRQQQKDYPSKVRVLKVMLTNSVEGSEIKNEL